MKLLNSAVACSSVANLRKMEIKMVAAEKLHFATFLHCPILERLLQVLLMSCDALEEDSLDLQEALNALFSYKHCHLP